MDNAKSEKIEILKKAGLVTGLSDSQIEEISELFNEVIFQANTTIIKEHEISDDIYVLCTGKVAITKLDPNNGKQHHLTYLEPNALIGEMTSLDKAPRSAAATTISETTALHLSLNDLQKFGEANNAEKKLLYLTLKENIACHAAHKIRTSNEIIINGLNKELAHTQARVAMGLVIITVTVMMAIYVLAFNFIKYFEVGTGLGTSLLLAVLSSIIVVFLAAAKESGYPLKVFGLTLQNWRVSFQEAFIFTLPILLLILLLKFLAIKFLPAWESHNLFEFPFDSAFSKQHFLLIFAQLFLYLLFIPFQELIVRGALQSSLEELLISPRKKLLAILMSNLLFGALHTHFSIFLTLPIFLLGLFWGWLYSRHRTLVGVIVSHYLIGIWAFFILKVA